MPKSLFSRTRLSLAIAMAAVAAAPAALPSAPKLPAIPGVIALAPRGASASDYELLIYGDIGDSWWGESVAARDVVDQLNALDAAVKTIYVRINSYGGSVSDGLAIFNALKRHAARKVVTVDGVAMSIASLIAMAGDEIQMPETALMMIHAPWGLAQGNANDMRTMATILDTYAESMVSAYSTRSKQTKDAVRALLTDGQDHYYIGEEAVANGFADKLINAAVDDTEAASADDVRARAAGLARYLPGMSQRAVEIAVRASGRNPRSVAVHAAGPKATPAPTVPATTAGEGEDAMRVRNQLREGEPVAPGNAAATPAAPAVLTAAQITANVMAQVRARNEELTTIAGPFLARAGVRPIFDNAIADPTVTVATFREQVMNHIGATSAPANAPRTEGGDDRINFVNGVTAACVARAQVNIKPEAGNQFNGIGLQNIVRMCLVRAGVSGVDRMAGRQLHAEIMNLHTTSDFPLLLANTANKVLRAAYDLAPSTWQMWCAIGEVSDFKVNSRLQMGSFNSLSTKLEGAPYNHGTLSEEAETAQAATKGRAIALTREMVINDDLGAFLRISRLMGFAAKRTVNEDVYTFLDANGNTSDGGALFNTTAKTSTGGHANLSSSSDALSVAAIGAGEKGMGIQTDVGLNTTLNLVPKYLLVPRGKRRLAWELVYSATDPSQSNAAKRNFAQSLNLEIVSDAEMDKHSATAWYLTADQNLAAPVEVVFLDGVQEPYTDEQIDFDTDALVMKVRLDYGVGNGDYRGGWKNPGA